MQTLERCSTVETHTDGGVGWLTLRRGEHADVRVIVRDAIDALAEHIDNPNVQTIVVAGLPAAMLNGSLGSLPPPDGSLLAERYRNLGERLRRSSKTLIVRRHADSTGLSTAPNDLVFIEPLTGRERQVLSIACEGASAREIGERLFISERTVESHVSNGYRKLGIRSRIELVRRAAEFGLCAAESI